MPFMWPDLPGDLVAYRNLANKCSGELNKGRKEE